MLVQLLLHLLLIVVQLIQYLVLPFLSLQSHRQAHLGSLVGFACESVKFILESADVKVSAS